MIVENEVRRIENIHVGKLFPISLSLACFDNLFIQPRLTCLRTLPPTMVSALLHCYHSHRHVQRPVWWRQFFNWGSLYPDMSSLQPRSVITIHHDLWFLYLYIERLCFCLYTFSTLYIWFLNILLNNKLNEHSNWYC